MDELFLRTASEFNPLMPGGNKKVIHTQTNLQLKTAGLFKNVWPFCYHQALKGLKGYMGARTFGNFINEIDGLVNFSRFFQFGPNGLSLDFQTNTLSSQRICTESKFYIYYNNLLLSNSLHFFHEILNCITFHFNKVWLWFEIKVSFFSFFESVTWS